MWNKARHPLWVCFADTPQGLPLSHFRDCFISNILDGVSVFPESIAKGSLEKTVACYTADVRSVTDTARLTRPSLRSVIYSN